MPHPDPALTSCTTFDAAWQLADASARLPALRKAALAFREQMLSAPSVSFYRSFELVRAPYPTRYGLRDALRVPTPFMHIVNRVFIVQSQTAHGLRTLVFSPTDADANEATPFFDRLGKSMGPLQALGRRIVAPKKRSVAEALAACGLTPEDVDYISYDHLHTQDLRPWLGTRTAPGFFPRAKLLVMRQEWATICDPTPPQRDWYCPQGAAGVDPDRVLLLDHTTLLGDNIALMATPGHTEGNHSLVVRTPEGLMVTSENGVGPDAYAPDQSEIPGLRDYAKTTGMEVVLNGNTLERGLDQYLSMVVEKTVAGPSVRDARFPNVVCSSEFDAFWGFPGLKPTFRFGDLAFGQPQTGKENP